MPERGEARRGQDGGPTALPRPPHQSAHKAGEIAGRSRQAAHPPPRPSAAAAGSPTAPPQTGSRIYPTASWTDASSITPKTGDEHPGHLTRYIARTDHPLPTHRNACTRQTLFFVVSSRIAIAKNLLRSNNAGAGPEPMEMKTETINGDVAKIILTGRLDILGAQQIDLHFTAITGSQRKVIVDLEGVLFLASMGIRTLIMGAKSVKSKGGRMV